MGADEPGRLRIAVPGEEERGVDLPEGGTLVVGSSADLAGFVVSGQGVDEAHCALGSLKDGGWGIKDLGSRYGTFVNGRRVRAAPLAAGDRVVLGSVGLVVYDPSRPPQPEPAVDVPRIGGYRIERRLGRGGMGEVLLAVQESLHRPVALKRLSHELASDSAFVARFHSEARAAAALSHPNVVVVHDVGEVDGEHLLAMEYMPGGNLEERLEREGRLPWREVLDVLHDAASGLAYAEAQGIVHRDIKPANLMVAASGAVKIADLGLAMHVQEAGSGNRERTFGTPHFISPEQARGGPVDHRSDLYSLGATAYRLLSGRTPFQGEDARAIVRARFVSEPQPLDEVVPEAPAELVALVHRLMAREPAGRFASATDLLGELDLLRLRADHGDGVAVQDTRPRRGWLVGLVLLAAAGLGGAWLLRGGYGAADAGAEGRAPRAADGAFGAPETPDAAGGDATATGPGAPEGSPDAFFAAPDGSEGGEPDEERRLDDLEREALLTLGGIPDDLPPSERITELRRLTERFAGTDTARQAEREIADLRGEVAAAEARRQVRAEEVARATIQLHDHVGWPVEADALPRAGQVFGRLESFPTPAPLQGDASFAAARTSLAEELFEAYDAAVDARVAEAERLAAEGDFAGMRSALEAARDLASPGQAHPDEAPQVVRLRERHAAIVRRLASLDDERDAFLARLEAADRDLLGRELGPGSGMLAEVEELRLAPLEERLARTRRALKTNTAIARVQRVERRIERARSALDLLVYSHARGMWRRDSVSVPDGRRSTGREVLRMLPEGVVVADDDGRPELVPWAVFAGSESSVAQLFRGRLARPYTAQELSEIATLLGLPAVARAVRAAGPGLDGARTTLLSPSEAEAMEASFEGVFGWLEAHADDLEGPTIRPIERDPGPVQLLADSSIVRDEIQRDREAVRLLVRAILARQEGAYTEAISRAEYLLSDYADSLVVLLLSQGAL